MKSIIVSTHVFYSSILPDIRCEDPPDICNTEVDYKGMDEFVVGKTVKYSCKNGYKREGMDLLGTLSYTCYNETFTGISRLVYNAFIKVES